MREVEIQFINEKIQKAYFQIEDDLLKKFIDRALEDICKNPFCGIQIAKKLIPEEYIKKYEIENLWKYDLPGGWRLIYSIEGGKLKILAIILEWFNHKKYERRFGY